MTRENLIQQIKSNLSNGSDEGWAQIDAYFELSDLERIHKTMEIFLNFSGLLILDIFSVLPFSSKPIADYQALYLEKAGHSLFYYAILSGNMAAVRLLAERRLPLDPDYFLLVAFTGNIEMLDFLERYYCNFPNARYQINPPLVSIFRGSKPRTGVDFTQINHHSNKKSMLHFAARGGNEAMFGYILQKVGVDFLMQRDGQGRNVLGAAVRSGNVAFVRSMIQDHHLAPDCNDYTLFTEAGLSGSMDMVRFLIEERHYNPYEKKIWVDCIGSCAICRQF